MKEDSLTPEDERTHELNTQETDRLMKHRWLGKQVGKDKDYVTHEESDLQREMKALNYTDLHHVD